MKKSGKRMADELRREYKRADFGALVRGKHVARLRANSSGVVRDPGTVSRPELDAPGPASCR